MKFSIVIYLSVLLCCMISLIWKRRKTVTAIPQVKGFEFSARWPLVAWAWACCLCLNFFLYLCVSLFSSWPLGLAAGTVFSSCWQLWQLLSFVPKLIPVLSSAFHGCPVLAGHHPHPHYHPLLHLPRDPSDQIKIRDHPITPPAVFIRSYHRRRRRRRLNWIFFFTINLQKIVTDLQMS